MGPDPTKRHVAVDLVEANLCMALADLPATPNIVGAIASGEEISDPAEQRLLESLDLGLSACEHPRCARMAMNLDIEIVDDPVEGWLQQSGDGANGVCIGGCPVHISLQLAIALNQS